MMRRCWTLAVATTLAAGLAPGCKSEEAGRMKEAYDEVIDYSLAYKEHSAVYKSKKLPGHVWAVDEIRENPQRPALAVDIRVPGSAAPQEITALLEDAARQAKAATNVEVVWVQAWPAGLVAYGGILGFSHLVTDGRGWDGKGTTFRGTELLATGREGVTRPSRFDLDVLAAMERHRSILLADPRFEKKREGWVKKPATLDQVVADEVAPTLGLTPASLLATAAAAKKYWLPPRWQPKPQSVSHN
jgi:hypothetical protein